MDRLHHLCTAIESFDLLTFPENAWGQFRHHTASIFEPPLLDLFHVETGKAACSQTGQRLVLPRLGHRMSYKSQIHQTSINVYQDHGQVKYIELKSEKHTEAFYHVQSLRPGTDWWLKHVEICPLIKLVKA